MASHDVTFLLTDTRESRWLPTLIAAANDTLLINSALGMDTYLIQRHGGAPLQTSTTSTATASTAATTATASNTAASNTAATDSPNITSDSTAESTAIAAGEHIPAIDSSTTTATATAGTSTDANTTTTVSNKESNSSSSNNSSSNSSRLGCYFCSDVVAPDNSQLNRTLDQQCTVTRPGLAPIAAALAVELMVAVLHHPLQHHAPADSNLTGSEALDSNGSSGVSSKSLGLLPHQVSAAVLLQSCSTSSVRSSAHVPLKQCTSTSTE
jgi:ubiquitin-like modifier-activating enzyme ATG7